VVNESCVKQTNACQTRSTKVKEEVYVQTLRISNLKNRNKGLTALILTGHTNLPSIFKRNNTQKFEVSGRIVPYFDVLQQTEGRCFV